MLPPPQPHRHRLAMQHTAKIGFFEIGPQQAIQKVHEFCVEDHGQASVTPGFEPVKVQLTFPPNNQMDGAFAAAIRRV